MSLILSLNLTFGIMFVLRTVGKSASDPLMPSSLLTKIGTALVCSQIFVAVVMFEQKILAILAVHALALCVFFGTHIARRHSKRELSGQFELFIRDLVMNLKLGMALEPASQAALAARSETFTKAIRYLLQAQSIYIGQAKRHVFISPRALEELRWARQQPHSALRRLSALRDEQQLLSDFRRRSGQATAQAQIQCLVLWVLLFALSAGVLWHSGWAQARGFLLAAILLFVCGQLLFNRIIRKGRWKL